MAPPTLDLTKLTAKLKKRPMSIDQIADFCGVTTARSVHRILGKIRETGLPLIRLGGKGEIRHQILI